MPKQSSNAVAKRPAKNTPVHSTNGVSKQATKRIDPSLWLAKRPILERLWLTEGKSMRGPDGIVETMKNEHNFDATENQYETRFKNWNWRKNQTSDAWAAVAVAIHERERQGWDWEVFIGGVAQPRERIAKKIAPYAHHPSFGRTQQLPSDITIRSPSSENPSLTINLPFHFFLSSLQEEAYRSGLQNALLPSLPSSHSSIDSGAEAFSHWRPEEGDSIIELLSNRDNHGLKVRCLDKSVITAMDSVIPQTILAGNIPNSSLLAPDDKGFASPIYQRILFSVANNFAGLGAFSAGEIARFLQRETNEQLYRLISSVPGPSSRAIVQNIFKGAVEIGSARIVDLLLREKGAYVALNKQFCHFERRFWTPIELATILRHHSVVSSLLHHGADVNRTYPDQDIQGALNCAAFTLDNFERRKISVDPQLFRMLLDAGGELPSSTLTRLIIEREVELAWLNIAKNAPGNFIEWTKAGVFLDAIKCSDDETSLEVVQTMIRVGADLSYCERWQDSIIDVAADSGKLATVRLLCDYGVSLTGNTLPSAIASGNEGLIRFLLFDRKAGIYSLGSLRITPLAAAIKRQRTWIIDLLKSQGATSRMNEQAQFLPAFEAASELGNNRLMEELVQLSGKLDFKALGHALTLATTHGNDKIATKLIDAGADTNTINNYGRGPPLREALEKGKWDLVLALLDADALPNYLILFGNEWKGYETSLQLAIEYGHRSIVQALLDAGADVNDLGYGIIPENVETDACPPPLTMAVRDHDEELIDLLLQAGADVNHAKARILDETALSAAVWAPDLHIVSKLLKHGADPNDPGAIEAATDMLRMIGNTPIKHTADMGDPPRKEFFDLILEHYNYRYPKGCPKFGSQALKLAIYSRDEGLVRTLIKKKADCNSLIRDTNIVLTSPFGFAISKDTTSRNNFVELFLDEGRCSPNSIVAGEEQIVAEGEEIVAEGEEIVASVRLTALLAAVGAGNDSTVRLLIRRGADINCPARGSIKRTSLQRAAELGNAELVNLLMNLGADVNAAAAQRGGGTALQLAAIGGYAAIVCTLLSHHADVDAPASIVNGRTALEGAAEHGRLDTVQILLNAGADSDPERIARAVDFANKNGHFAISDLLETHIRTTEQSQEPQETPIADENHPIVNTAEQMAYDYDTWNQDMIPTYNDELAPFDSIFDLSTQVYLPPLDFEYPLQS